LAKVNTAQAIPREIFSNNGDYFNSSEVFLSVEVVEVSGRGESRVDLTFYNNSFFNSSVAGIYFDNESILGVAGITDEDRTSFSQLATPGRLPNGNALVPKFRTIQEFSASTGEPSAHNGIYPGEWVKNYFRY
jgi:hypothetical protein